MTTKIFIIFAFLSIAFFAKAQASTITLKDGRDITGDIVEESNAKVTVKVNDVALTYYKEDILSIDGRAVVGPEPAVKPDPDKEKIVDQLMKTYPTEELVYRLTKGIVPESQKRQLLQSLSDNSDIQKITEMRKKGLMEDLSLAGLKALMSFNASPEGKVWLADLANYQNGPMIEFYTELNQGLGKAMKSFLQNPSLSERSVIDVSPSGNIDPDKEKLVDQYMEIYPTDDLVEQSIEGKLPQDQQQAFWVYLTKNSYIKDFTEMRKTGLMESLSSAGLKAMIDFSASPDGQEYFTGMKNFRDGPMREIGNLIRQEAKKTMKQLRKKKESDPREQSPDQNST